jgi:hypothetical protein
MSRNERKQSFESWEAHRTSLLSVHRRGHNKLRVSFFDVVQNKMPHLLKWRRFQKRKEFLLPSHRIQRFAETRDMILGYRPDFINHDAFL